MGSGERRPLGVEEGRNVGLRTIEFIRFGVKRSLLVWARSIFRGGMRVLGCILWVTDYSQCSEFLISLLLPAN